MKTLVQYVKEHKDDLINSAIIGSLATLITVSVGLILLGLESWTKGFGFYGLF